MRSVLTSPPETSIPLRFLAAAEQLAAGRFRVGREFIALLIAPQSLRSRSSSRQGV